MNRLTMQYIKRYIKRFKIICLSSVYKNNDTRMRWKCHYGHCWWAPFTNINRTGHGGCKKCAVQNTTNKNGLLLARKIAKDHAGKCLSLKYKNNHSKLKWKCKNGHIWFAHLNNIKESQTWCLKCANNNRMLSLKDIACQIKKLNGTLLSKKYYGAELKLRVKCSNSHCFYMSAHAIKRGQWCPLCKKFKTQKKLQNILEKILKTKAKFNFRGMSWLKNPNTNRHLEIDLWFPEIKLAVEYDGKQHFDIVTFGKMSKRMAKKRLLYTKKMDKLKNKLFVKHKNDILGFIRFKYDDPLTLKFVTKVLKKNGILK